MQTCLQLDSSLRYCKERSQEKTKNPINHAKSRLGVKLEINYVKLKTTWLMLQSWSARCVQGSSGRGAEGRVWRGRGLRGETRYQAGWNSTMLMHSFIIESESLLIRYKVSNGYHFLYGNTTKKRRVTLFIKLLVVTLYIPTVIWTTLKQFWVVLIFEKFSIY